MNELSSIKEELMESISVFDNSYTIYNKFKKKLSEIKKKYNIDEYSVEYINEDNPIEINVYYKLKHDINFIMLKTTIETKSIKFEDIK